MVPVVVMNVNVSVATGVGQTGEDKIEVVTPTF